jgi:hydroxymethylbilane synthase
MSKKIILGTRGSELARAQAQLVIEAIQKSKPDTTIETKIVTTQGDRGTVLDRQAGRKGLFTAEIERALLAGDIDVAVHSAKDLPSEMSHDAEIAAVLARAAANDVLVSKHPGGFNSLPRGSIVATGSVRRMRQLIWKRADLKVVDLRGNIPTRLRKLAKNDWNAIVLARAGLKRLGLSLGDNQIRFEQTQFFVEILPCEVFLSAGGQGVIALQIRTDDQIAKAIVAGVNHSETLLCLRAEREFLRLLHGDCNCPVGVQAIIDSQKMKLKGQLFGDQSAAPREAEVEGARNEGEHLASELLRLMRA